MTIWAVLIGVPIIGFCGYCDWFKHRADIGAQMLAKLEDREFDRDQTIEDSLSFAVNTDPFGFIQKQIGNVLGLLMSKILGKKV